MERRKFLEISLCGGLAMSGMGVPRSVEGATTEDQFALMREENREFEAGFPPG